MREIMNEYGQMLVNAAGCMLVLALAFSVVFFGARGIVAASGQAATIEGDISPGMSNAETVASINSASYTLSQQTDCIRVGVPTAAGSILSSTDPTAVFSVTQVIDENSADALKNGRVSYDRKTHSVTANQRGIYSIEFRASGKQLMRKTISITAL